MCERVILPAWACVGQRGQLLGSAISFCGWVLVMEFSSLSLHSKHFYPKPLVRHWTADMAPSQAQHSRGSPSHSPTDWTTKQKQGRLQLDAPKLRPASMTDIISLALPRDVLETRHSPSLTKGESGWEGSSCQSLYDYFATLFSRVLGENQPETL